jgi:hypothetical protein
MYSYFITIFYRQVAGVMRFILRKGGSPVTLSLAWHEIHRNSKVMQTWMPDQIRHDTGEVRIDFNTKEIWQTSGFPLTSPLPVA